MARFSRTIEHTITGEFGTASGTFIVESDGWSGEPYIYGTSPEDIPFEFHAEITNSDGTSTCDGNANTKIRIYPSSGYNGAIIGLALENFIAIDNEGERNEEGVIGPMVDKPSNDYTMSWGGVPNDPTHNDISGSDIQIKNFDMVMYSGTEYHNVDNYVGFYTSSGSNGIRWAYRQYPFLQYVFWGWVRSQTTRIKTNLPIFETNADLWEYINSGGTITDKILNKGETPEEEYNNQFKFHFVKNIYGHNTQNASSYTGYRNYRFYPASKRMCFYRVNPSSQSPFTLELKGADGVTVKSAPVYADPLTDDDKYTTQSGEPELLYLHKSISFGTNDYYSKFRFYTDLPVYGSESQAQDYIDNIIDERSAENWNDISRAYSETYDPNYGDPDDGNDNGVNGQSYVKGARMWVMESTDLNDFFDDIFNDINISDILNGCQLFGQSAISCIMGVMYLPIDVDDVATVYSTKQTIKLGSWACPTAKGRYVQNNNKIIDCGSFFVARVYNDFRDYEMKLALDLPYIGTVETSIGRYLGKTLSIKYAVDITTGGCTAHIYSDNLEMESHDGFMASVRPIQALDQISHLNAVMSIVGSIGGRETGMINTATESFAGVATGSIGQGSNGGFNAPSSGVGPGGALELSAGAITDLYSLGQAVKDKPIAVRGSYAGCLGLFGPQKIHIRVQQPRIYRAPNLQQIAGFPSGVGQRVGMFSGFLSVISFQMVDGFPGTADELQEIYGILKQGIYI